MLGISCIIKNMIKFKTCPNIVITGLDKVLELFNVDPPPLTVLLLCCVNPTVGVPNQAFY